MAISPAERLRRLILGCLDVNTAFVRRQLDRGADVNGLATIDFGVERLVSTPLIAAVRMATERDGELRTEALQIVSLLLEHGAHVRLPGLQGGKRVFSRLTDVVSIALRNSDAPLVRLLLQPRGNAADADYYGEATNAGRLIMDAARSCPQVLPAMLSPSAMTAACDPDAALTALLKLARLYGTASDAFVSLLATLRGVHGSLKLALSWKCIVLRQIDEPLDAHVTILEQLATDGLARVSLNLPSLAIASLLTSDPSDVIAYEHAVASLFASNPSDVITHEHAAIETLIGVGATSAQVARLKAAGLAHSYDTTSVTPARAALPRLFAAIASRLVDPACIRGVLEPLSPAERIAAVNERDVFGQTPLVRAVCVGAPLAIVDALLTAGATIAEPVGGGDESVERPKHPCCYVRFNVDLDGVSRAIVDTDSYITHACVKEVPFVLDAVPAVLKAYCRILYVPQLAINPPVPLERYECHPQLVRTLLRLLPRKPVTKEVVLSRSIAARLLTGVLTVPSSAPPALLHSLVLLLIPHVHADDIMAVDDECDSPMSIVLRLCRLKLRSYLPLLHVLIDRFDLYEHPGWFHAVNGSKRRRVLDADELTSSLTSTGALLSSIFSSELQTTDKDDDEEKELNEQAIMSSDPLSTRALVWGHSHSLYYELADLSQRDWAGDAVDVITRASDTFSLDVIGRVLNTVMFTMPARRSPCDCGLCSAPADRQRVHTSLLSLLCDAATDTKVRYDDSAAGTDAYGLASAHAPLLYHAALTFDPSRHTSASFAELQLLWCNALYAAVNSKDVDLLAALLNAMIVCARILSIPADVTLSIYITLMSAWSQPGHDPAMIRCHMSADFQQLVPEMDDGESQVAISTFLDGGAVAEFIRVGEFDAARALLEAGVKGGHLLVAVHGALTDREQLHELLPPQTWTLLNINVLTRNVAGLVRVLAGGAWARCKHALAARQRLRAAALVAALPSSPRGLRRPREEEGEGEAADAAAGGSGDGGGDGATAEPAARRART